MPLTFYNTLTKRKQEFVPVEPGRVKMYNCGPTVYMFAHIGNFRSFMLADLLRRYLEYKGFAVDQVMNITDVGHLTSDADEGEDKLEKAARTEKKDPWQIAEFYTKAFFEDIDALGVRRATRYPRATEHVADMIETVKTLIARGHAYVVNGCVYYDVTTFDGYGRLSGNTLEKLNAGARLDVNPDKRNPHDFSLWVTDPKHLMKWESPWGVGYPGWHLECSTMSQKYLGDTLDIHTGGEDNIFPHHECEIAQSEGATGKPFVNYWLHVRHLFVEGKKMSKSLGNFYTLRDLIGKGLDPTAIRYTLLSSHYRQPLNFTFDGVEAAAGAVKRLTEFVNNMDSAADDECGTGVSPVVKDSGIEHGQDARATGRAARPDMSIPSNGSIDSAGESPEVAKLCEQVAAEFETAMDDDLNIALALGRVFDFIRDVNKLGVGAADAVRAAAVIRRFDSVLGVLPEKKAESLDAGVERLIEEREAARKAKDFKKADAIRTQLAARGITLKDTPGGVRWEKK